MLDQSISRCNDSASIKSAYFFRHHSQILPYEMLSGSAKPRIITVDGRQESESPADKMNT